MALKIEGMDKLIQNLEKMGRNVGKIKKKAVLEGAKPIRQRIADTAPRSPYKKEHAADHIVTEYDEKNEQAYIGPDKEKGWYLIFPEFGTSKQPAQGFTQKAFEDTKGEAQRIIAETIRKELGLL